MEHRFLIEYYLVVTNSTFNKVKGPAEAGSFVWGNNSARLYFIIQLGADLELAIQFQTLNKYTYPSCPLQYYKQGIYAISKGKNMALIKRCKKRMRSGNRRLLQPLVIRVKQFTEI